MINAGGDANLIGSQVKGKRVEVNAQNLNIESLQDTATYKGKQMNGSGSVTVGLWRLRRGAVSTNPTSMPTMRV